MEETEIKNVVATETIKPKQIAIQQDKSMNKKVKSDKTTKRKKGEVLNWQVVCRCVLRSFRELIQKLITDCHEAFTNLLQT